MLLLDIAKDLREITTTDELIYLVKTSPDVKSIEYFSIGFGEVRCQLTLVNGSAFYRDSVSLFGCIAKAVRAATNTV